MNFGVYKKDQEFPTTAEIGDILYYEEDNKIYEYDEGLGKSFGWRPVEMEKDKLINLGLTEYDINKMVIIQLPSLITNEQLAASRKLIKQFTHTHILTTGYYMLLCNDIHYYTVFEVNEKNDEAIEDIVIECLQEIGVIQQINKNESGDALECWIKNNKGVFMFMLFNYDWGVVKCQ